MGIQIDPQPCKSFAGYRLSLLSSLFHERTSRNMKRTNPDAPRRRSRPLTVAQEIVLLAAAFAAGGMLQMLVILRMAGILD